MKLSHGLAVSAVSALAVSGIAVTAPAAHAAGPQVRLISIYNAGHDASTRPDGSSEIIGGETTEPGDAGISLVAALPEGAASVAFEYNLDPEASDTDDDWTPTGSPVDRTDGFASTVFAPEPGSDVVDSDIAVRVVATSEGGTTYSTRRDVHVSGPDAAVNSVRVATGDRGFFVQPYAGSARTATLTSVNGTTSATEGTVELSAWRAADGTFAGRTAAAVTQTPFKVVDEDGLRFYLGGAYTGAVDLTGFGVQDGDVVAFGAERDTDGVQPAAVYEQSIAGIVVVDGRSVANGGVFTTRVDDQEGRPVVGAEVRRLSDGSLVGYTDALGQVTSRQADGEPESYYANTTDVDAYEEEVDVVTTEVVTNGNAPVATDSQVELADGAVFDDDEYAAGDVAVLVTDQFGDPVGAGTMVRYRLYPTGTEAPAEQLVLTTGTDGRAVVPFDPAGPDGGYTLEAEVDPPSDMRAARRAPSTTATFVAGQAALTLTRRTPAPTAGGQVTYQGRLSIGDDRLQGRLVGLRFTHGVELVPGRDADAGILVGDRVVPAQNVVTDRNGVFRVTVKDPVERPRAGEIEGALAAATLTNRASTTSTLAGNADARAVVRVDFSGKRGRASIKLFGIGQRPVSDILRVEGPASIAGETVKIFKIRGDGSRQLVRTRVLDKDGDAKQIKVRDRNRRSFTRFVAMLVASKRVEGATSNKRRLR
ncbi:hypothetical protein ABFT23_10785 [Nocardioides sp. C4-1]|uniref:hypothetical protein n=1 Tax=Nocardioides sp. C4-1 TaxID=3151851 RepID=UPI003266A949